MKRTIICFWFFLASTIFIMPNKEIKAEENTIEYVMEVEDTRDEVSYLTDELCEKETLLITEELISSSTCEELLHMVQDFTGWNKDESLSFVSLLTKQTRAVQPRIYQMERITEWVEVPHLYDSEIWVHYSKEWLGIDAYRSSVGMSKGMEESKTISLTLGFSGDKVIKDIIGFNAEGNVNQTTTVSASQTCPAWTTMNWRPYIVFRKDYYKGKKTTYIKTYNLATGEYTISNQTFEDYSGVNSCLVTKTTEMWSRVNEKQDVMAPTPLPPTTMPIIQVY